MLNIDGENLYEVNDSATLLTSGVQGGLQDLVLLLIKLGVSLDTVDGAGLSAIMYSLVYREEVITRALIDSGADVNAIDRDSNSVIKYSLLSIRTDDISRYLPGHIGYNSSSAGKMDAIKVFGAPVFLTALLDTQKSTPPRSPPAVDVNVRDNQGYSTLLTALGQGELNIKLGGYKVQVLSSAYNDPTYPEETIHEAVLGLLNAGGWLSVGSLRGVVPMHVAAARGDMKLIQLFADKKAALNPVDIDGFLPLHFLVSSCPNNAIAVFNELMSLASHRPMEAVTFEDYRTGQSLDYKNEIELDKHIDDRFLNAIVPQAIIKRRLSYSDLLLTKTK